MQYYTRSSTGILRLVDVGRVIHRLPGTIPGILKAQDVFVEEDGYLVIKNPCKPYRPAY